MDILAAGQALRSCATSSRGGKGTTTTYYYSSFEGSGLGSGEGTQSRYGTSNGNTRDTVPTSPPYLLSYLLDATLFFPIFVTLSFIGLDVILHGDVATASELIAIVEAHGAVLTTRFNTLLDLGNYERRAFYALIFAAAFIWLASSSLERLHTLLATRDTHDPRHPRQRSPAYNRAAHRFRGGGDSDSDSDGRLSVSGLYDEDEVEELGAVDGLAREGFLDDADRDFVNKHGGTTASKQRAPIQGRRHRRPGNGECLYHSLSQSNNLKEATKLKKLIAGWVRDNWNQRTRDDLETTVAGSTGLSQIGPWRYFKHITGAEPYGYATSWGGLPEIIGFTRLKKRRVAVYATNDPDDKEYYLQYVVGDPKHPLIRVIFAGNHFDNLEASDKCKDTIPESSTTNTTTTTTSSTTTTSTLPPPAHYHHHRHCHRHHNHHRQRRWWW